MTDSVRRFVSVLIRAANEVDRLTLLDRTRLFQRAATLVRDRDGPPAVAYRLSEFGRLSDNLTNEEISVYLLEAAEAIKATIR